MQVRRIARPVLAGALALAVTGCTGSSPQSPASPGGSAATGSTAPGTSGSDTAAPGTAAPGSAAPSLRVTRTVIGGLRVPWGLTALPDGSALLAERDSGRISRVFADGARALVGILPVSHTGESGLLGLAASADGRTVFAYYTSPSDNRVVSLPFEGRTLGTPTTLLTGIPKAGNHDGGRLLIGPDGNLWISTGDAGRTRDAQNRGSLGGKILRIRPDGSVPPDNPFAGSPVWSFGHRNVQGLAFDSTGQLWATEFGQNTWDELNRVQRGGNHGWPVVEGQGGRAGFVDPQVVWPTDEASPSGLAIVNDVAYVMALRGTRIWQVPLTGGQVATPKAWFTGTYGRLRSVLVRPDGRLWVSTSNRDGRGQPAPEDDRVLEVTLG
jgi:glucose/arabinose dehydrogenase